MAHRNDDSRSITAAGLARLLARLDPDTERAGLEYERLRRALIKFFDWRGAWPPEECADAALDRLARRLEEDTSVEDVRNYAHGIARLMLLERQRQPVFSSIDQMPEPACVPAALPREPGDPDDNDELLRDCFDRCLAAISADSRSLVIQYYEGERQAKISNRRGLAAALGLSDNALRSRVQRLRDHLEQCVQACVSVPK
jgi:DNA-directed RNA polymerase specialized sigma24 family protein